MTAKKIVVVVVFAGILCGTLVTSKSSDFKTLQEVFQVTRVKVTAVLPDAKRLAGPLAALHAGDALPIEERVRVRIQTDKKMSGGEVSVQTTPTPGEIRLRGSVETEEQRRQAIALAESTNGVEKVMDELTTVAAK